MRRERIVDVLVVGAGPAGPAPAAGGAAGGGGGGGGGGPAPGEGAPPETLRARPGGERGPSSTRDPLGAPDGSPPVCMTVTEKTATDLDVQWG
ncbi:hypothetical protein JQK87_22680, partial [Streptomyces sp. G44]|nr:hypothetical protein [Streptomyces sp. G44]